MIGAVPGVAQRLSLATTTRTGIPLLIGHDGRA